MIKLIGIFIVLTSIGLSQTELLNFHIKSDYQNWEENHYEFKKGYYYNLSTIKRVGVKGFDMSDFDHQKSDIILGYLLGKGIKIEEAWFRSADSSCGVLDVWVMPSLCIRLKNDSYSEYLATLGFLIVDGPVAQCPYSVKHYLFYYESD